MAVPLTAFDLLVKVEALSGGPRAFADTAPNRTFCTDGRLARLSFMAEADRRHFLATAGLSPAAFARADRHGPTVDADWVEVGRYGGIMAAWRRGEPQDPLVVPVTWTPADLEFGAVEDVAAHLERLGVDGNVEVYLDRRTGKKVYAGRTRPAMSPDEQARLEALHRDGADLVGPFLTRRDLGFFERRRVKKGIAKLTVVLAAVPDAWNACWMLGMSYRGLGDHAQALELLRRAYVINPQQVDVGREYAGQCFFVGAAEEGIRISRELHARFPADVGLHSNLALALLIGGDLAEAAAVAESALAREPDDPITRNLVAYIADVRAGARPRPTRMPGM